MELGNTRRIPVSNIESSLDRTGLLHRMKSINQDQENLGLKRNSTKKKNEIESATKDHVKVDIESRVRDFARIRSAIDNVLESDNTARIKELREKIDSGAYQINYEDTADIILRTEY